MAGKKTEEFSFDDDFSMSFDDDGFGGFQSNDKGGGKRKAVTEFAGSFLSGVKKSLLNQSNQRKFLAKNMPDGYLAAFDAVSMGARGVKDVYSSTKDELNKSTKDIAKDVAVLNKHYGKNLPQSMQDKLNRKLEQHTGGGYTAPTEEQEFNSDLDAIMNEVVDVQRSAALLQQQTTENTANRIVASQRQGVAAVSVSNQILSTISGNSERQVGLGVTGGKLQRKSIELTYKQYIVQRQMLDTLQQTQEMQREAFTQLIKNTGLPEAVKQTNWELTSKSLKQKMIGMATERATAGFAPVASHIFDTAKKNLSEKVQMGGGMASMFTSMLAMQAEMGDMMGSKTSRAGEAAGGIAGWAGQKLLRSKLGDKLKNNQKLKTQGDAMMNFMDSFPGMFNKLQQNGGGFAEIMRMLGVNDILVPDSSLNTRVRGNGFKHLDEMTSFNRQSQMALTEIIPGWLGKIHHELAIMRTGDDSIDEQRFDIEKGTFATKTALRERATKQMFNKDAMNESRGTAHRIVNQLDSKNELSKKDRAVLMKYVLQQANSDTGYIDPQALMSPSDSPLNKTDPKAAQRIADVLSKEHNFNTTGGIMDDYSDKHILTSNLNSNTAYQSRMRGANDQLKELRRRLPNSMRTATANAGVGNIDMLAETGAVKWDENTKEWRFNNDAFYDTIISGRGPSSGPPNSSGVGRSGPPNRPSPTGGRPNVGGGGDSIITPTTNNNSFGSDGGLDGGNTRFQQELLETLERVSSRASSDAGNQILEAIRQRLDMGIPQGGPASTEQDQNRKSKWFRNLLSGSMQGAGKGIKSYFKFAAVKVPNAIYNTFVKGPLRIVRGVSDLPGRLLRGAFGGGTSKLVSSNSKNFKKAMGDLYVKGKDSPVIKWKDLQAGEYFDQKTKKVIKSFKDIKGAIVDKAGNVIVSEEEFKSGIHTIVNGKTFSILGGAIRSGLGMIANLAKAPFTGIIGMAKGVGSVAKFGFKLFNSTPDVYVRGETSPRLLGRIMSNGGYFNKDGSPIKSVFDIVGEVVDSSGDVVLSVADMAKGLVDKRGRPFKSLMEKLKSTVFAPVKVMFKGAMAMGRFSKAMAMLPFKIMGKGFKGISSLIAKDKTSTKSDVILGHMSDSLTNIYQLLQERMPKPKGSWNDKDGSGFRDGSREDILASRNKDGGKVEGQDKGEGKDKDRKGIIGILMAIAGGIGGLIGTVKGWASNIFGLMRMAAQTRMATSALDLAGSLAGGGGGGRAGRGGKLGRLFGGAKNFFTKSKIGKTVGLTALAAGAVFGSQTSFAQSAVSGAANAISGNDEAAYKDAVKAMGNEGGGSSSSGGSEAPSGPSTTERLMNGIGGSVLGEIGAIAAFPALAALYNKAKDTKLGGKVLPQMQHGAGVGKTPTSKMGKAWQFLSGTNKGRILSAGLMGGGLIGANHLVGGDAGASLADETSSSFRNTLLLELGMATAAPWAIGKGKELLDARKARKLGIPAHSPTPYSPVSPMRPGAGSVYTPVPKGMSLPKAGVPSGISIPPAGATAPTPAPRAGGIMAGAKGLGKGIFRNAGLLGTGYAAYDALTTEGSVWDKTKAFGSSLLTTAAVGKGLSLGGELLKAGGRQVAMQGLRTGAMYGATALASTLGAPVVLGALAVAATGFALWKGYKYFFGKDKNAIVRFRMAQYGFKLDDKEKASAIGQFEQLCQKNVVLDKDGKAKFKKNMSAEDIFKTFGIDPKDQPTIDRFIQWFEKRFKPVFLNAYAFYHGKTGKNDLEKADSLDKETKLKMLNAMAAVTGSPYEIMETPFPDGKKLKFDADDVKSALKTAIRMVEHEKGKDDKSLAEKASNAISDAWNKTKELASAAGSAIVNGGRKVVETVGSAAKAVGTGIGAAASFVWGGAKAVGRGVQSAATTAGDAISTTVAKMTGSQKEWQMRVYKAFKGAGFSEQQARILTAEIGRENSYNPKYMFAGHADPHKGSNLGMLSWQGDRKPRLVNFLKQANVLDGANNMIPGQEALNAQARFIMWELKNTHKKVGEKFLSNPNISYKDGAYLIGKKYILWRIDDPKYAAAGKKNRDGFYNMLLKQLGAKDGDGKGTAGDTSGSTSGSDQQASTGEAGNSVTGAKPATQSAGPSGSGGGGGWFGYMVGGGGAKSVASTAGGGYGGGTDLVAAAKSGEIVTGKDASAFIKSIDPKLIALGQKSAKVQNSSVDLTGMVKGFMIIFYGMVGEGVQRGIIKGVQINSAYRSIEKQRELYNNFLKNGKPLAARPGSSNHNFGIALDINSAQANALNAAGLLSKYGFHRPIKSEAWHLESTYFKKGKNTEKEVTKSVQDSGNKATVKKSLEKEKAADPVVQAQKKVQNSSPAPAASKPPIPYAAAGGSAEANLKALSSGFMGGGSGTSSWMPSGGVDTSAPAEDTPMPRVDTALTKSQHSPTSTQSAYATQQAQAAQTEQAGSAMLGIAQQQLDTQHGILAVLTEIRDMVQTGGGMGQAQAEPPKSSSSNRAAEIIRGKSREIPVSMSIKR